MVIRYSIETENKKGWRNKGVKIPSDMYSGQRLN
jgi:hypothetical protein